MRLLKPRTAVSENTRTASSEGTRRSDSPRAARVASRVACAARSLVVRAPPPARGWSEGVARAERRTGREKKRRRAPQRVPSLLDCGSENRPRRTIVARASSVAMHAGEGSLRTKRQAKKTRDVDNRADFLRCLEAEEEDVSFVFCGIHTKTRLRCLHLPPFSHHRC